MQFKKSTKEKKVMVTGRILESDRNRLVNLGEGCYSAGLRILLDSSRKSIDREIKRNEYLRNEKDSLS